MSVDRDYGWLVDDHSALIRMLDLRISLNYPNMKMLAGYLKAVGGKVVRYHWPEETEGTPCIDHATARRIVAFQQADRKAREPP